VNVSTSVSLQCAVRSVSYIQRNGALNWFAFGSTVMLFSQL
jgi:hypothetical protein